MSEQNTEYQKVLGEAIAWIPRSLDLETIFKTQLTGLRKLLKADRVALLRFSPQLGGPGEFVYEDVADGWNSLLNLKVQNNSFPDYQKEDIQAVTDIDASIDPSQLSESHGKILREFQVKANLVVPVFKQDEARSATVPELWGLLCIHQCSISRQWQDVEIEIAQKTAQNLAVIIRNTQLLEIAHYQVEQQKTLAKVIKKIRTPLDLEEIFQVTVTEVRELFKADRVAVFRFDREKDWEGEFVSEDVVDEWDSALAAKVYDYCFGAQFAIHYQEGRVQAIADIYGAELSDCHIEILGRFQVKANLVVPLRKVTEKEELPELWGLLCIHQCSNPRNWQDYEIEFAQQIADHFGVALRQGDAFKQVVIEKSAERQKTLAGIVDKIRRSLDIETIFQTTTQQVQQLLNVDRVAIFRFHADWSGEFMAESVAEGWVKLIQEQKENPQIPANVSLCSVRDLPNYLNDTYLQQNKGENFAQKVYCSCNDIYKANFSDCYIKVLESYQARAYAIVAIYQAEKLWGLLAAYQNSAPRKWEIGEVELLAQIGGQLGVALQQAEYFKQVQVQAAELEKATERQKALSITIDKIRQSLDINTIFQTTTQEVRQLLEVERVGIYRFYEDWSGEFVADSMIDALTSIVNTPLEISPALATQSNAGKLPRNETFVPILQGEKLWGLLVAYQNSSPRYWQDEEINLLAQVGVQLGIALKQAELLEKTRTQAEELKKTLQDLKQTQIQMIRGEKMAGLGQLVAGIAHEINNPVNFIYGNLNYVEEYAQNLLDLMKLYSKHYVDPVPEIKNFVEDIDLEFVMQDLPKTMDSLKLGSERIRQLVFSLRTFSRLDESEMKAVDLHQGIDSTLLILQHRFKARHKHSQIEVVKNYGNLPLVKCHAAQINQVFMNILSNAIDTLEEKRIIEEHFSPTVTITTAIKKDNPGSVLIKIADNGLGITPEAKDQIFNLFFTTKDIGKGTGLGLAISYEIIVQKHGGQISCNSEANQGSEFMLEIPIQS